MLSFPTLLLAHRGAGKHVGVPLQQVEDVAQPTSLQGKLWRGGYLDESPACNQNCSQCILQARPFFPNGHLLGFVAVVAPNGLDQVCVALPLHDVVQHPLPRRISPGVREERGEGRKG